MNDDAAEETKAATRKYNNIDWSEIIQQNAQVANAVANSLEGLIPKNGRWHEFKTYIRVGDNYSEVCGASLVEIVGEPSRPSDEENGDNL